MTKQEPEWREPFHRAQHRYRNHARDDDKGEPPKGRFIIH